MLYHRRHILILMHPWAGYLQGVLYGIADYLLQRPDWFCTRLLPVPNDLVRMSHLRADGVIGRVEPRILTRFKRMGVPVVDVANWMHARHFPRVLPDDAAIGKMAAEHLLDLGLRQFGVIGPEHASFHGVRRGSFERRLAQDGLVASAPYPRHGRAVAGRPAPPSGIAPRMAGWLMSLPKPSGVFATTDHMAMEVLEACHLLGIRVPEDLCVIGVDSDELIARFTRPPLTSIALPTRKIGFEAARLLEQLMEGASVPARDTVLPPLGVVTRQSTSLMMIADPDVQTAVRHIHEHVHKKLTVQDLLKVVPLNRRYLERRFRQVLGRTPLQEICRARVEKAKDLLSGTDLSLVALARRSGFANARRLAESFREATGMTPSVYRKRNRNDELL